MSCDHPLRHAKLYIDGGDVVFQAENILFRVHSFFFTRESAYFRDLLHSPDDYIKLSSDEQPIILDGCSGQEFTLFCWVFYNQKHSIYEAGVKQWALILKHANAWGFKEIAALAVRELEKLEVSPVVKIDLYQKNGVDGALLHNAFEALTKRPEPLSPEEGERLGFATFAKIAHARELSRSPPSPDGGSAATPLSISTESIRSILTRVGLSPIQTSVNGVSARGPNTAPALTVQPQRPFDAPAKSGSLSVPPTPLETILETPISDAPPSYVDSKSNVFANVTNGSKRANSMPVFQPNGLWSRKR